MRPKKAKELIPAVAERMDIPVKTVEDIVNFYWREVWSTLTGAENIKVHVTNLGDFNIKHWLLDKELTKLENFQTATKFKGTQRYAAALKTEEKIKIVRNLKYMVEEENQRKEFIYEHKKATHENQEKELDTTMEE